MTYKDENTIKELLVQRLRRPVNDAVWEFLQKDRYVDEAAESDEAVEELVVRYQAYMNLARDVNQKTSKLKSQGKREIGPDSRLRAMSTIYAKRADQEESVRAYRATYLRGRKMDIEEAYLWIRRQSQPLEDNISPEFLECFDALNGGVIRVPISGNQSLILLKELAVRLARDFVWHEAKCVLFVLTGTAPQIPKAIVSMTHTDSKRTSTTITIEVEDTASPEFVRQVYSEFRDETLEKLGKSRHRSMSEKHLNLAEFYKGDKQGTWLAMLKKWNQSYPAWAYDENSYGSRNFRRDCIQSMDRLVGDDNSSSAVVYIDGVEMNLKSLVLSTQAERM